ncbi:MAG: hypothetical protein Q4P22_06610 [Eubacteriales bacterium]|nr:hypothetical protein [Eubacteriales bacterium]
MAKIVKTETQEQALKDINEKIKIISAINPLFTEEVLDNTKLKVTADKEDGNQVNTVFPISFALIAGNIKEYRKKLVNEVITKAKANAIILDEDDTAILNQV